MTFLIGLLIVFVGFLGINITPLLVICLVLGLIFCILCFFTEDNADNKPAIVEIIIFLIAVLIIIIFVVGDFSLFNLLEWIF